MKMLNKTIIATAAGLALTLSAGAAVFGSDRDSRGQLQEKDYKFVKDASRGGTTEVEMGELAHQKGASQVVRNFGDRMVKDHRKANDELRDIASKRGATLPAELSHRENSTMSHLQKLTGNDFDKSYAEHMVKDHKA